MKTKNFIVAAFFIIFLSSSYGKSKEGDYRDQFEACKDQFKDCEARNFMHDYCIEELSKCEFQVQKNNAQESSEDTRLGSLKLKIRFYKRAGHSWSSYRVQLSYYGLEELGFWESLLQETREIKFVDKLLEGGTTFVSDKEIDNVLLSQEIIIRVIYRAKGHDITWENIDLGRCEFDYITESPRTCKIYGPKGGTIEISGNYDD